MSSFLEQGIDELLYIVLSQVQLFFRFQSFLTVGVCKLEYSLPVCGTFAFLDLIVILFIITEVVLVVTLNKLDFLFSILVTIEAAHHLVGLVVDIVNSETVDFGTSS